MQIVHTTFRFSQMESFHLDFLNKRVVNASRNNQNIFLEFCVNYLLECVPVSSFTMMRK